mgnify:CR=1 FL=1
MPCLILKTRRKTCSQPKTPRFQMIFGKGKRGVLFVLQASIFHKSVEISAFWQRYRSIRIGSFPRRVSMVILYTIKNHLCTGDYVAAVCAMKSTQLKQGRTTRFVTSTQEQYPSLFGKRFNLCRSQNDVQNTKAFSQQTIHVQIKRSTA